METGLQQAEQSFKSMLSDEPIDKQQQLNEEPEEAEVEIEEEEPEIEAEADSEEIEAEDEEPEDEQQASQPQEPDWDQLYEADPLEWMKQKENFRSQKERNLELQQQHYQMQQQQKSENDQQMRTHLSEQHQQLIEAIPEWQDQTVMQAEKAQIREYAKKIGYSDEEIYGVYDQRAVITGSAQQQPRKQTSVHKAKIKLAKSGKMSDAAEIFKQLF